MDRTATRTVRRPLPALVVVLSLLGCTAGSPEGRVDSASDAPTASAIESVVSSHTPTSSGRSTDTPRPSLALVPSPPVDLPTRLVKARDGIRVTIELGRNPLRAGEPTWATLTVQNRGRTEAKWFHDGCAIPAGIGGQVVGARWRMGVEHSGQAAIFKSRVVDAIGGDIIRIMFTPEQHIGRGGIGCADVGITEPLAPRESLVHRARWDGMAAPALGPPPGGPIELSGAAAYYYRGNEPADLIDSGAIEMRADGWIVGGKDPAWLDPPEVIDAALADPGFVRWIADKELGNGRSEFIRFDPQRAVWEVGTVEYISTTLHFVRVHPVTGAVLETVDRRWIPEVDGNP